MVYLDNAATTPICDAAKQAIIKHLGDFGNPSSSHAIGHVAKMLVEDARERIANCINASPDEIYFTSGGSEADNWAIDSAVMNSFYPLVSSIEHHALLNSPHIINDDHIIPCNSDGIVDIECLINSILKMPYFEEKFISCMMVNNEIGTVQDIEEIADVAHCYNGIIHTDAVQGMCYIPYFIKDGIIDMMSASAHKWGGIKGTGFLYVKKDIHICPFIYGGKQEKNKRAGTENVLGIVAMAAALEDYMAHMEERNEHVKWLRDYLLSALLSIDGVSLNGSLEDRVASNINVRINGVSGQDVVAMANEYGICISAGSACNEGVAKPSHVLKAIGLTDEEALSSIRITLGHQNTIDEIEYVCDILPKIISRLRQIN